MLHLPNLVNLILVRMWLVVWMLITHLLIWGDILSTNKFHVIFGLICLLSCLLYILLLAIICTLGSLGFDFFSWSRLSLAYLLLCILCLYLVLSSGLWWFHLEIALMNEVGVFVWSLGFLLGIFHIQGECESLFILVICGLGHHGFTKVWAVKIVLDTCRSTCTWLDLHWINILNLTDFDLFDSSMLSRGASMSSSLRWIRAITSTTTTH